jgi:hypothetical protein
MIHPVDPSMVASWIKGWTIARETPLPVPDHGGFRVDVGWPRQQVRYVFPSPGEGFLHLAHTLTAPWTHLKVCAAPEAISSLLPSRWIIQPPGFMMTSSTLIHQPEQTLPEGYTLQITETLPVPVVKILTPDHQLAAIGRIAFADDFVIYDRIETQPGYRRLGFGSMIMNTLGTIGNTYGKHKGVLVATAAGKALYETLGWETRTLYTTAVIPAVME